MGVSNTFTKAERLTNHHLIGDLFAKKGKSIFKPPLLFAYLETSFDSEFPAQVFISVGKKKIPKASDRNVIRRRIREAYRLNKHLLYDKLQKKDKQLAIALIYLNKEEVSYAQIEKQLIAIIHEINSNR